MPGLECYFCKLSILNHIAVVGVDFLCPAKFSKGQFWIFQKSGRHAKIEKLLKIKDFFLIGRYGSGGS